MVSYNRLNEMQDLNEPALFQFDYRQDLMAMSNAQIPIISTYHQNKEVENYYHPRIHHQSFTEYLSDPSENYITEIGELEFMPQPTTTEIFSMDDPKIKMEFPLSPLDQACPIFMSRTISQGSSTDLSVCNPPSMPLTPPQPSPHQLPSHLPEHIISEQRELIPNEMLMTSGINNNNNMNNVNSVRGRRASRIQSITSPIIQEIIPEQQEFHHQSIMESLTSPPPPPTPSTPQQPQQSLPQQSQPPKTGRSRGRRMTNKPSKPGTKSFECTYEGCGRIFKRSEHLKRHIRSIHTLERPFHCPFPHCTKRFSRSDNLSQHVRVHRPNGKEKNASTRAFNNFTPYLQTYQAGSGIHTTLQHN